ncbi:MAG: hypothetical protein KJ058_15835, partial [Thermoanaerobaculia bacterium]|nr:hypothetical protein [Thermoanaerobaculia bacterium]
MAWLVADPDPVLISPWRPGGKGSASIGWDTEGAGPGRVFLSVDGGPHHLWHPLDRVSGLEKNADPPPKLPVELGHSYHLELRRSRFPEVVLASLHVAVEERLGLPDGLAEEIRNRIPLAQGITRLVVEPGIESVRIRFRTRQPTHPIVEIADEETGAIVGIAHPIFPSPARTAHDFRFAAGWGAADHLAQETPHRFRIQAPSHTLGGAPAVVTGRFRTGGRDAFVEFRTLAVHDDGDPGFFLGAGDFEFFFGGGHRGGPFHGLSKEHGKWGPGELSGGDRVDLAAEGLQPLPVEHVSELFLQTLSLEEDGDAHRFFWSERPAIRLRDEGSTWEWREDYEISCVTRYLDLTSIPASPPIEIPFTLQTGPHHVNWEVSGVVRTLERPGANLSEGPWPGDLPARRARVRAPAGRSAAVAPGTRARVAAESGARWTVQVAPDGGIAYRDGAGASWRQVPLVAPSSLLAVGRSDALHLFCIGRESTLLHARCRAEAAPPGEWNDLGGELTRGLGACAFRDGRIGLWANGADGATHHILLAEDARPQWQRSGAALAAGLSVVASLAGGAVVVGLDRERRVLHRSWSADGTPEGEWERTGLVA